MTITLQTKLRPKPETGGVDLDERVQIQATGDDYDTARAALAAQVPDGWQMLGISRW